MGRRGVNHQLEAFLGRWKLGNVVVWMCSADVLLHRTIALFLKIASMCQPSSAHALTFGRGLPCEAGRQTLTPKQRFRQFEPS
jgi:hypothetical protein